MIPSRRRLRETTKRRGGSLIATTRDEIACRDDGRRARRGSAEETALDHQGKIKGFHSRGSRGILEGKKGRGEIDAHHPEKYPFRRGQWVVLLPSKNKRKLRASGGEGEFGGCLHKRGKKLGEGGACQAEA